jgi:hypothetical protein
VAFINQSGSLGGIRGLDPYLWRLPVGHSAGAWHPASHIQVPRRRTIREWAWLPQFRMRPLCGALATAGRREISDSRNRPIAAGYIRLSDKLLLGRFGPSTLSETHSWAAAVLVNEFDAANFQSAANGQVVRRSH